MEHPALRTPRSISEPSEPTVEHNPRRPSSASSRTLAPSPTCPGAQSPQARRCSSAHEVDPKLAAEAEAHDRGDEPPDDEQEGKKEAGAESDPFEVGWDGPDDKRDPMNWSVGYRWALTAFSGLLLLNSTFASSAPSGNTQLIAASLSLSAESSVLVISLFVCGYCVGPLLWGPLSEQTGRRPIFLLAFAGYTAFSAGCALSRTELQLLVCRFATGAFASAPLTNSGAILGDIWDPLTRGVAMSAFTVAPFAGPCLGPVVGGYMAVAAVDWRWLFWVLTMFAGTLGVLVVFLLPETYTPVLLSNKAAALRLRTGDQRYFAPLDRESLSFSSRLSLTLGRPFKILLSEPMHFAMTLYMSFIYGCLYLLFEAYPIVFTDMHGLNAGASGLCFLPVFGGALGAITIYLAVYHPRYKREVRRCAPAPAPPEARLEMSFLGAFLFAAGFFWFGWTSFESIPFWAPMMAGTFLGAGIIMIYMPLINYIIDVYLIVAASALASNTVGRSAVGAGFPLFAVQMFDKLGPQWASTLLGGVACVMIPIPFLLARYGKWLRRKSKYAPTLEGE